MSTNCSASNQSYKHLSEAERGKLSLFMFRTQTCATGEKSNYYYSLNQSWVHNTSQWVECLLSTIFCRFCQ